MVDRRSLVTIVALAAHAALSAPAGAAAPPGAFAVVDGLDIGAELHRVNLETGARTFVGPIGHPATQIAFNDQGTLYGVDEEGSQLLVIDRSTGLGTPVGELGPSVSSVGGLTFDGGGRLWMTAIDASLGPSLYEVDPATGSVAWTAAVDMAYFGALASDGVAVYIASYLLGSLDTATGVVTPVPGSTLEIWWARALDIDDSGKLWSLLLCGPCMMPWDYLITVDIDAATGLMVGDGVFQPHGTWGLAILPGGIFVDGFETGDLTSW